MAVGRHVSFYHRRGGGVGGPDVEIEKGKGMDGRVLECRHDRDEIARVLWGIKREIGKSYYSNSDEVRGV